MLKAAYTSVLLLDQKLFDAICNYIHGNDDQYLSTVLNSSSYTDIYYITFEFPQNRTNCVKLSLAFHKQFRHRDNGIKLLPYRTSFQTTYEISTMRLHDHYALPVQLPDLSLSFYLK